jgi:drug/metabolite transporter (DMT)-like permease
VVLAHFFLNNEQLTWPKSIGFLAGFAGILVLIGPQAILNLSMSGEALIGELAILLACLCYSIHAVTAKRFGFSNPILQTAAVCSAGALMGLIFAGATDPIDLREIPSVALWSVLGLGLLPTAFASLLMYLLIQRVGPSFVAYSNYLVPVYAVLFGATLMSESLNWNIAIALALILAGIAVSRWNSVKPQPSK